MNQRTLFHTWVLAVMTAAIVTTGLALGAEPAKKPAKVDPASKAVASKAVAAKEKAAKKKAAKVDPALEKARKVETTTREKERSLEMARSATREIARSERRRAEDGLENWRAAEAELRKAVAENRPKDQVAALRMEARERLVTRWDVAQRMIADTITANQRSNELFGSEYELRDKMAATRTVELGLLKAKAAPKDPEARQREVRSLEALRAMEIQQWAAIRKDTAMELVEQSGEAARIAKEIAAMEKDAAHKKELLQFAKGQDKEKSAADKIVAGALQTIADAAPEIHRLRSAAAGGLEPLAPEKWDYAKARHLLVRAGFGGTPQEVEKLHAMGLYKAVDHLVEFYRQPATGTSLDLTAPLAVDSLAAKMKIKGRGNRAVGLDPRDVEANQLVQIRRWWLQRMVESPRPLQEKLTLFWHGHFASQDSVVQNSYTMFRQNQFFREQATGNFAALLYGIVHDPAMIRYLDNNKNAKGKPNENLAREIMELFSMGEGLGYTEQDIVEAARALTGYNFDHATGTYRFLYNQHDTTEKTIFGKKGPWTGDDLVRLILEQPETSRFIARKLFEFFAYPDPDEPTIAGLAAVLKERKYALEPMLKNLFLSEDFYSSRAMGKQVKSPVELMVGLLRDLGEDPLMSHRPIDRPIPKNDGMRFVVEKPLATYEALDTALQQMGMQLMEPPDVKGWRYGRQWIDSQRLFTRYNAVASLIDAVGEEGVDVVGLLEAGGCTNSAEAVDYLAKACLARPLKAEKRKELIAHLGELPPCGKWASQRREVNEKLRSMLMLMLCVPEHQMS